jgi:hypothetical protein
VHQALDKEHLVGYCRQQEYAVNIFISSVRTDSVVDLATVLQPSTSSAVGQYPVLSPGIRRLFDSISRKFEEGDVASNAGKCRKSVCIRSAG